MATHTFLLDALNDQAVGWTGKGGGRVCRRGVVSLHTVGRELPSNTHVHTYGHGPDHVAAYGAFSLLALLP